VNKAELIDALATRLGDKRAAGTALDAVLAEVQSAVTKGDKVSITGFGVFEKRVRAARMARNPRTGAAVRVKKTSVPAFRPGAGFKEMVATGRVPKALKAAPAKKTAAKKAAPAEAAATTATAKATKKAPARKSTTKKVTRATPRKTATAKKAPAKRAPAKKATKRR
jgi:DNA-binding protein HU-beta